MAAMWRWMRLPEAEILPGITPASASTPNNEPLIAPGAHLAAATLCPPNNRKTFREAFIKKKSVTFFTLGSDPPPILRKV